MDRHGWTRIETYMDRQRYGQMDTRRTCTDRHGQTAWQPGGGLISGGLTTGGLISGGLMSGELMSSGLTSGELMSGGLTSSGLMSSGLMS